MNNRMLTITKNIFIGIVAIFLLWGLMLFNTFKSMSDIKEYTEVYEKDYSNALIKLVKVTDSVHDLAEKMIRECLISKYIKDDEIRKNCSSKLNDISQDIDDCVISLENLKNFKRNYFGNLNTSNISSLKQRFESEIRKACDYQPNKKDDDVKKAMVSQDMANSISMAANDLLLVLGTTNVAEERSSQLKQAPSRISNEIKGIYSSAQNTAFMTAVVICLVLVIYSNIISKKLSEPISKIIDAMSEVEKGQLNTRLEIHTKDEFEEIARNFNHMLDGICIMISRVLGTSDNLATSSQELSSASVQSAATLLDISKNVNGINNSSLEISHNLEKTSNTVEHFSNSAQQVAVLAAEAVQAVVLTTEAADKGGKTVKQSVEMIGKIKESVDVATQVILDLNSASLQISEIVNTITAISSQTNLLALNAAIEAVRAGEQGKGFTVVAGEVRKLAEESAEAAEAIATRIENILTKTQNAVDSMTLGRGRVDDGIRIIREVNTGLDNIIRSVNDVNRKITEISAISSEQSENSLTMAKTIEDITSLTKNTTERLGVVATSVEQQTTTVSQVSNATEDLANLADEMHLLVSRFTIK